MFTGGCFVTSAPESVVMKLFNEFNGGNFCAVRYADNIKTLIGNDIGQLEELPAALGIFRQWSDRTQLLVNTNQIRDSLKIVFQRSKNQQKFSAIFSVADVECSA